MTGYRRPTSEQVASALRRIPTFPLRRAFYEGLKNPHWVKPLADAGAFETPPQPIQTSEGDVRDVYWPEIVYLTRVAVDVPDEVVDVFLGLGAETSNAWVRRAVFQVGANIPADKAVRLRPLLEAWASSNFGWRSDPHDLVGFALNLLEGGQHKTGAWLANRLFRPYASPTGRSPKAELEVYWYCQELPRLARSLGKDGLAIVAPWLEEYERLAGHVTEAFDISDIARESVRVRGETYPEIEHALIDVVRDLAISAMADAPVAASRTLMYSGIVLLRKIAMHAVSEAIKLRGESGASLEHLVAVGTDLVLDVESVDDACRIEWGELTRSLASAQPGSLQHHVALHLQTASEAAAERRREHLVEDGIDPEAVESQVNEFVEHWRHRWLAAAGPDALTSDLATELLRMNDKHGAFENPLKPVSRITTWIGPTSPLSQDELAAMSPLELVTHLESWRSGEAWGPNPTHEGQGRELATLLAANPKALQGVGNLVDRLRPTYLRSVLQGWEAAAKAGLTLDWKQVLDLVRDVLVHEVSSQVPTEGRDFDDDADFRGAKRSAVDLLEELAKVRDPSLVPARSMPIVAHLLIESASDDRPWRDYVSSDGASGMDPLTTSLNWQWPTLVRALVHLVTHGEGASWYDDSLAALDRELARADGPAASRAVLGEGLGRLLNHARDWILPRVTTFFGSEAGLSVPQQVALTTALTVHRFHPALYELLSEPMLAMLHETEPITVGWTTESNPMERTGEWVVEGIVRGRVGPDDRLRVAFFSIAPASARGAAIGSVAWTFMHADVVDDVFRDRLADLWDERVAYVRSHLEDHDELAQFHWFVKSGKFPPNWWLPRLKEAAELSEGVRSERYFIGDELAAACGADPAAALDVLEVLVQGRDVNLGTYDLNRAATPTVIAAALDSGDENVADRASELMNRLGEQGAFDLELRVNEARAERGDS